MRPKCQFFDAIIFDPILSQIDGKRKSQPKPNLRHDVTDFQFHCISKHVSTTIILYFEKKLLLAFLLVKNCVSNCQEITGIH